MDDRTPQKGTQLTLNRGTPAPDIPQGPALADAVEEHYHDILSLYGAELGLRVARKHLGWYADANGAPNRAELLRAPSPAETVVAIRAGFAETVGAA